MTEAEWLTATDPAPMLTFIQGRTSERKLRLFACACVRPLLPLPTLLYVRLQMENVLAAAERFADGAESKVAMTRRRQRLASTNSNLPANAPAVNFDACRAVIVASQPAAFLSAVAIAADVLAGRPAVPQADLARCTFGNPFHPVAVEPSWLTSTVTALATGIYAERAFDRMPILADALQDAGCDNEDVLNHCRQPGAHARGCWVVDLVLAK
jgi:hypothetical protein